MSPIGPISPKQPGKTASSLPKIHPGTSGRAPPKKPLTTATPPCYRHGMPPAICREIAPPLLAMNMKPDGKSPSSAARSDYSRFSGRLSSSYPVVSSLILLFFVSVEKMTAATGDEVHLTAKDVFNYQQPILFEEDFQSNRFTKWSLSEDDHYNISKPASDRLEIVKAPEWSDGKQAVRFSVPRGPNSFRAEISLPSEKGFNERWYGERIFIPHDWVFDPNPGVDIVMQWHAIPGNWRATFPNLEISIGDTNWFIRQSYGAAQTGPTRTNLKLDDTVRRGTWVSWVIHAKWSPDTNGLIQIWKDGKLVMDKSGPNVYSTIGVQYTPYFKTGIYRPEWHLDQDRKREAFARETPAATDKVIYATDIKVGSNRATFEDVVPKQ